MKIPILAAFFCWNTYFIYAQNLSAVFESSNTSMEFVGLDFSQSKMVGKEGFKDFHKNKDCYFKIWNALFLSETNKYDVKRAFMKPDMKFRFSVVDSLNNKINYTEIITENTPKPFSTEELQSIINQYNTSELKANFGLSFVVHSFNKYQERAYIYVVIFDVSTKKILLSEKMTGETGGFGFRNYWAKTIYNILEDIRDYQFRRWKKEIAG